MARNRPRRRTAGPFRLPQGHVGGGRLSDPSPQPDPPGAATLELELPPEHLPRLLRASALVARRNGRSRTRAAEIVWHDTPEGTLAKDDLALSHIAGAGHAWRLERLRPNGHMDWLPAGAAPVLAEADAPDLLGRPMPETLVPIAAFQGRSRTFPLRADEGAALLCVLDGTMRGVSRDRATCRVILSGEAHAIAALAGELAEAVPLSVPRAGLAAQAIAIARGQAPAPRGSGAPSISPGASVDDALAFVTAHLADVILHWASLVGDGNAPEPVHQMRVGVRRLRSALSVFRRAVQDEAGQAPWLDELAGRLKALAAQLGTARDWDVFLAETGNEIGQAFAADSRVAGLLAAAARRRVAAYVDLAALFGSQAWTRLELTLALLPWQRPWMVGASPEQAARLAEPVEAYAPRALDHRLKHVLAPGDSLATLPASDLHGIRKQAKRLRYATEFFAGLFPDKPLRKYLPRLEKLQAVLGEVNDAEVATALMAQLGPGRAFAIGVVQGFGAGRDAGNTKRVQRAWSRFYRATPFWD